MADEAKKGFWPKIFRVQKSSCCSMQIEEVREAENPAVVPTPAPGTSDQAPKKAEVSAAKPQS